MTHLPPDPPIVDIVTDQRPERKERPASVLAAPRNPVTRWNRKYLLAGAAALAAIVGLGFYLGFGGASATPKKSQDLQAAADTENPQKPEIANRYAGGYADPAVRAAPGTASLPPPGAPGASRELPCFAHAGGSGPRGGGRPGHGRAGREPILRRRPEPGHARHRSPEPRSPRTAGRRRAPS